MNWNQLGHVTPAKNQEQSDACEVFAITGVIESQVSIRYKALESLSEQSIIDCTKFWLPGGDAITNASEEVKNLARGLTWLTTDKHGYVRESSYPFVAKKMNEKHGECRWKEEEKVAHTDEFGSLMWAGGLLKPSFLQKDKQTSADPDQMMAFVRANGPILVALDDRIFQNPAATGSYVCEGDNKNCFVTQQSCDLHGVGPDQNYFTSLANINHVVQIVGYGTDGTHGDYWVVKNSWGEGFGDRGFINVPRGTNCGLIESLGGIMLAKSDSLGWYRTERRQAEDGEEVHRGKETGNQVREATNQAAGLAAVLQLLMVRSLQKV